MPPSSQTAGRPRLNKQSSSSQQSQSRNRNIHDFFKPFTIPKSRIPVNDVVEEEIVVASPRKTTVELGNGSGFGSGSSSPLSSPVKSQSRVGRGVKLSSRLSTPTKGGKSSPKKGKRALQLDGAGDEDDLHHESPPCSQQRVMSAVEIPTPSKPRSQARAGTETDLNGYTNAAMNNTSFNSMSSLISVPLSSQASSSRRIVKDGIPLVTNSDSGSAGDSEDELQDIVIPRKKMRMTPPPVENETTNAKEVLSTIKPPRQRHSGRISAGNSKKSQPSSRSHTPRRRLSPTPPPRAANANSLLRLVREKEKREKAEARIREAETAFETEQKVREEKARRERDLGGGLKALVPEDSDEGERMMLAVERTEAMGREVEEFYYFKGLREDVGVDEPRADDVAASAPWKGGQFTRLKGMVVDSAAREQAALSGFLAEVAERYGLPPELLGWMFDRLVMEAREEVCEAYVEVFRRYLQREGAGAALFGELWASLSRIYRTEECRPCDEDERRSREEQRNSTKVPSAPPQGLRHVVRVVQYVCSNCGDYSPHLDLSEMALACVDTHVSRDAELKGQLQESMAAIIDSVHPNGMQTLAYTICNESLTLSLPIRCRVVASLPAYTGKSHRLRRILALCLVANVPVRRPVKLDAMPIVDPNSYHWAKTILDRLRSAPEWHISESTDYAHLNALIPILDIAIDAGFSSPVPSSSTTTTAQSPSKSNPQPTTASTLLTKRPAQSAEEKAFNAQIDTLTDTLRLLAARIRDAGTSHLRRTEAKSALERVVVRLEHCVRTGPRPRKGVFGGGAESKGFMSGFLQQDGGAMAGKKVDRRDPEDRASVISTGRLSDRGGDIEAESEDAGGGAEGDEF